jgi:TfoX/Sxy family transcriptional regulator of competence genes
MAYDENRAARFRELLQYRPDITERKMFGGLVFMLSGNMLCGVHSRGSMFRVGKESQDGACRMAGVKPLAFTGRPMGGFVDVSDDALFDDECFKSLLGMALTNTTALPPK